MLKLVDIEEMELPEVQTGDKIFSGNKTKNNKEHSKPNVSLYVFVNTNIKAYTVDLRNITTVIPFNKNLKKYNKGIYIIERLCVPRPTDNNTIEELIEANQRKTKCSDELVSLIEKSMRNIYTGKDVRFVKYIDIETMEKEKSIFIENMGLMFTLDPQREYPKKEEIKKNFDSIELNLRIIDNENPHKFYYTKILGNVHKIESTVSSTTSSGIYYKDENGYPKKIELEDKEKVNIYEQKIKSQRDGNMQVSDEERLMFEKTKLEFEKQKLQMQHYQEILSSKTKSFLALISIKQKLLELNSIDAKYKSEEEIERLKKEFVLAKGQYDKKNQELKRQSSLLGFAGEAFKALKNVL